VIKTRDKKRRTIVKTLTWRVIATLVTIEALYLISDDIWISIVVGLAINFIKSILYFVHERLWEHIGWGRKKHPLSNILINNPLKKEDEKIIKNKLRELGYFGGSFQNEPR